VQPTFYITCGVSYPKMEDFSVLNARDPSIAGWRRPNAGSSLVKNLRSVFAAEDSNCSSVKQPLKVYLRMKPHNSEDAVSSVSYPFTA